MSLVADEFKWKPDYLERVPAGAAAHGGDLRVAAAEAAHHRLRLLFLVTLLQRWARRGLTAQEITRGLRATKDAQRSIAGLLGARNAAVAGSRPWFRKDPAGRWRPVRALRWEPWLKTAGIR